MKAGFDPLRLAGELEDLDFALQENLSPTAIERRYFQERTDRLHAFEHVHFARAVVV
jgi:hypothetical protein